MGDVDPLCSFPKILPRTTLFNHFKYLKNQGCVRMREEEHFLVIRDLTQVATRCCHRRR